MCKLIYRKLAQAVAKEMVIQLKANEHKGDRANWVNLTSEKLVEEIHYHTCKLTAAITAKDKEKIKEYAADVANLAGMVMDVERVIDLDKVEPTTRKNERDSTWCGSFA